VEDLGHSSHPASFGGSAANAVGDLYPNIQIDGNTSNDFEVSNDGLDGEYGYPQFQTFVDDANGDLDYLGKDELYYGTDHVVAKAEILTSNSTDCPVLTSGSPYQTFGTNSSGSFASSDELSLEQGAEGPFTPWSGSPDTANGAPYYFSKINGWPATFQTNGPANSAP
jgi:hypothetical protein